MRILTDSHPSLAKNAIAEFVERTYIVETDFGGDEVNKDEEDACHVVNIEHPATSSLRDL